MDLATIIGFIAATAVVVMVLIMDGGSPAELFAHPSAILLCLGGSFMATMIGYSLKTVVKIPKMIMLAFMGKKPDAQGSIDMIVKMADQARREGLLALESQAKGVDDDFMRKGLMMVVDGVDPDQVRAVLKLEIKNMEERHHKGSGFFEQAAGYAPTFGIIGTVMGLISVLQQLDQPSTLGEAIAAAFLATLWGLISANLIYGPIAAKLSTNNAEEAAFRHMMVEGIIGIQAGENPRLLREKLLAFLPPKERQGEAAAAGQEARAQA